jgi:hypothetical protein
MRIVGVHGVGNFRPGESVQEASDNLSAAWLTALSRGRLGAAGYDVDLAVTYYADVLRPPGRQGGDVDFDQVRDDVEAMIRAWLDEFDLPQGIGQGAGTYPLRQAVAWIAARRRVSPKVVEWFVATFFSEVAHYLRDDPHDGSTENRRAARERVIDAIRSHGPRVVIAHSLGSVVTYEALWAEPSLDVELLITMGSPLALPHAVFPRLLPAAENGRGRRPPGVRRWINLADPGDLVAIPVHGVSRYFSGVALDAHDVIHTFDFHRAAKYLTSDVLAEVLRKELRL